jgi:hypothetical protein
MEEIRIGPHITNRRDFIGYALAYRKDLIRTKPIMDRKITQLDQWLIKEPTLPITAVCQIYTRLLWVTACDYEKEDDPLVKHFTLLEIREHIRDFQQLPEKWQELLRPHWMQWVDVLNCEEERWEQANAQ